MGKTFKKVNEITVKLKCNLEELYKNLECKNYKVTDRFLLDDTYFVPKDLEIEKMSAREILKHALLVRYVKGYISNREERYLTYKIKEIDENGNIIHQESINCQIADLEVAKKLVEAIGYKFLMRIMEEDVVYEKEHFSFAVKDIQGGDKLIEIEEDEYYESVDKIIQKLNDEEIPVFTDNYFVKKAEIEMEKVLGRKR